MRIYFIWKGVCDVAKTKCVVCGKEFYYKCYRSKCCSDECLSEFRKKQTTKQRGLNYDNVIGKIERHIVNNYYEHGITKTLKECLKETHISSKTFTKYCKQYNTSYDLILSKYNISKQHSKFQMAVTKYVRKLFKDALIIEEATFDCCINPKTNYKLKFDIYIPDKNMIIECDGIQHNYKESYFNKLTEKAGYTPCYITDKIKECYCNENNIKLVRIPYSRVVNEEYVYSFL